MSTEPVSTELGFKRWHIGPESMPLLTISAKNTFKLPHLSSYLNTETNNLIIVSANEDYITIRRNIERGVN